MTDAWPSKKEYEAALRNINLRLESLAARAGSTMAKARAYLSAGQSNIAGSSTWVKILLDAESYDPGNNFDPVTNHRFVAPVSGYYHVSANIGFAYGSVISGSMYIAIRVDGTMIGAANCSYSSQVMDFVFGVSDCIYLAAGSYVELYALVSQAGATADIQGNSAVTWLAIHLLSGV